MYCILRLSIIISGFSENPAFSIGYVFQIQLLFSCIFFAIELILKWMICQVVFLIVNICEYVECHEIDTHSLCRKIWPMLQARSLLVRKHFYSFLVDREIWFEMALHRETFYYICIKKRTRHHEIQLCHGRWWHILISRHDNQCPSFPICHAVTLCAIYYGYGYSLQYSDSCHVSYW